MIKTVIFDMDGTIFESFLDWQLIRHELGIGEESILESIYSGPKPDHRRLSILESYEESNTLRTKPMIGIREFLLFLRSNNISPVLVTNNNLKNTAYLLDKFKIKFDDVITREKRLWKPGPDAFRHILDVNGLHPDEVITVGDSYYDIISSERAGLPSVYIIEPSPEERAAMIKKSGQENIQVFFFLNYPELTGIFKNKYDLL